MNKLLTLTILSALLFVYCSAAKTCGDGPAIASFEADVVATIPDGDTAKTAFTEWKKTSAVDFVAADFPDTWKTYFNTKKICCTKSSLGVFTNLIKAHLRGILDGARGDGYTNAQKISPADALKKQMQNQSMKCIMDYLKAHPMTSSQMSASASVSVSQVSSPSLSDSAKKLGKQMQNDMKKLQASTKVGFGIIAKAISQMFRGTRIALCLDPDSVNADIWADGVKALQTDADELAKAVAEGLKKLNDANNRTISQAKYESAVNKKKSPIECDYTKIIDDFAAKANLCKDDPDCSKTAKSFLVSAWTIGAFKDKIAMDAPAPPAMRNLESSTLQTGTTGVSCQVVNDAEDDTIVVIGGETLSTVATQEAAVDSSIAVEGSVDYTAAAAAAGANSNLLALSAALVALILTVV